MIHLLYGPGEVNKRNQLLKLKSAYPSEAIFNIDLKQEGLSNLQTLLRSEGLFVEKRLVIAENCPDSLDLESLSKVNDQTELVLLAGNLTANSKLIKAASQIKAKVLSFGAEKEVSAFPYLDNLIERKSTAFIELDKLLREYGGIYVLSMIYYLLRRNLLPLPTSSFMKNRIKVQGTRYKVQDWERLYKTTLETEYKIKTGLVDEVNGLTRLTQDFLNNG